MADRETPGATAPDEGERAPDRGGARGAIGRVIQRVTGQQPGDESAAPRRAPAPPELEQAPSQPMAPAAPAKAPAPADEGPRRAFERWAVEKLGVVFDARSRATGVKDGKALKGVKNPTRLAATINGARALHRIPVGKTMTEAEFNKLLDATSAVEVR